MKTPPADLARRLREASEELLRPGQELRLEDVAALVGSKRATLYYYFSGRDDLVTFLLDEHMDAAAAVITGAEPTAAPDVRLRAAVAGLIDFLGARPGVCGGLLTFAGATGRVEAVMAAKDRKVAEPLRAILEAGKSAGVFTIGDARDAADAILGAIMIATMGRWQREGAGDPAFAAALTGQLLRGVQTVAPAEA